MGCFFSSIGSFFFGRPTGRFSFEFPPEDELDFLGPSEILTLAAELSRLKLNTEGPPNTEPF